MKKRIQYGARLSTDSFKKAEAACNRLGLDYNFRSVKFLLDNEGITFGQLRVAQFFCNGKPIIDYVLGAYYLVLAGLAGSSKLESTDAIYKRAEDIMFNWQNNIGSPELLWIILIYKVENLHFFIDSLDIVDLPMEYKTGNQILRQSKMMKILQNQSIGVVLQTIRIKNFSPTVKL